MSSPPKISPNRRRRLVSGTLSSHTVTGQYSSPQKEDKDADINNASASKFELGKKPLLQLKKTEMYQRDEEEIMEADSQDEMHTPQGPALRGPAGLHLKLKAERSKQSNHSSPERTQGGLNTTCFAELNLRKGENFFDDDIQLPPRDQIIHVDESSEEEEKVQLPPET